MMPPYTSLWLQILLEIKGTAAWLRTGEASPASERGRCRHEGPCWELRTCTGAGATSPHAGGRGHSWRRTAHALWQAPW